MTVTRTALSLTVTLLFGLSCVSAPIRSPASTTELLLRGGTITVQGGSSVPTALAIRDGKIIFVGGDAEAATKLSRGAAVVDLAGAAVLPAFIDAHIHPIDSGVEFAECYLYAIDDVDALLDRVRDCVETSQTGWLRGSGWAKSIFGGETPKANPLDEVETTGPIALMSSDGHSYWVNHVALKLAGINETTQDPRDGIIGRIPGTNSPNGFLYEGAMDFVERLIPKRSYADQRRGLLKALSIMHENGIVSFHDAYVTEDQLRVYSAMMERGEIPGLVSTSMYVDSNLPVDAQLATFHSLRKRYENDRLRVSAIKIFLDGTIEDRTAALLKPYIGVKGKYGGATRGRILWSMAKLLQLVELADRDGFQIHFHAIGDAAVRAALDAVERAQRKNRSRDRRHMLSHVQVVDPADVPRFARLGVIANFQPLWAIRDENVENVLGPERAKSIYPIGAVLGAGGRIAFGSDWAVTSLDPRPGIETAVRRTNPGEIRDGVWTPEQKISVADAIAGYTTGSAYANFWERRTGVLRAGMRADLVVVDRDPVRVPANQLAKIRVQSVFSAGKRVYERFNPAPSDKTP